MRLVEFFEVLLLGIFSALNAYLLAWLCGPAIQRLGQKWEEGRIRANDELDSEVDDAYARGWQDGIAASDEAARGRIDAMDAHRERVIE